MGFFGTSVNSLVATYNFALDPSVRPLVPGIIADGQLMIGSTVAPNIRVATLTAGVGISIVNGHGSITINSTGSGIIWSVIGASQTLAINHGYFCTTGTNLSLALPAVSAVGDTIKVVLDGSTSWTITQPNAGSQIRIGNTQSTLGATGTISSSAQGDSVELVCETANGRWVVINSMGNINFA